MFHTVLKRNLTWNLDGYMFWHLLLKTVSYTILNYTGSSNRMFDMQSHALCY